MEREQSRSSLVLEDDNHLPKATPEPYDPEHPTLTVTLSRGPRAPTVDNGGNGGHRAGGHHGFNKVQQQDGNRGDSGWGGGFPGHRGGHRDNSNHRSRNRYEVESNQSDEKGQRDRAESLPDSAQLQNPSQAQHNRHAATTTTNGRATVRNGGGRGDSATKTQSIKRAYARFDTNVLIALHGILFSSDHNVPELVHFTSALQNVVESLRVSCDDTESVAWTRGSEKVLERHVLRSMSASCAQAAPMKTLVTYAFAQGGKLLDAGQNSQEVFDHILRALCRGSSRASPATVMQALQNLVVPHGTPFSVRATTVSVQCRVFRPGRTRLRNHAA